MLRTFSVVREIPVNTPGESISSLQRTFDPPRTFAIAKARVASNAAEFRR